MDVDDYVQPSQTVSGIARKAYETMDPQLREKKVYPQIII